jgi:hypothetical protein
MGRLSAENRRKQRIDKGFEPDCFASKALPLALQRPAARRPASVPMVWEN